MVLFCDGLLELVDKRFGIWVEGSGAPEKRGREKRGGRRGGG